MTPPIIVRNVQDATIGLRTTVHSFASVIRQAVVGADCNIATQAMVDGATIGDRCKISHGAFICPGVQIGNDVFIGPYAAFCNDLWPRTHRDGFDLEALVSRKIISIVVEDCASIGAHATILPGVIIGANAMIAAGAVVDRDVWPNHLFRRDGEMRKIDTTRTIRRMRAHRRLVPVAAE